MRSPAAAIAWEFRQRHRWGLLGVIAYLVVLAAIKVSGRQIALTDEAFAFFVIVPLTSTCLYFLAVFSFGLSGDLAARQSMYPARMFALPVRTAALAGWPMLFGSLAMAALWMATRFLALWPPGVEVPLLWPALLGASLLAWTQALTWMPYALPGLRVVVTVIWLAAIDAIVLLALNFKASEGVMLAILAPHLPLAYVVARFAVARARRGDVPDWRMQLFRRRGRDAVFSSSARAQTWFEWRQYGRSLPSMVAIVLPFELALLFAFRGTPALVMETLVLALFTPVFMAAFVAATVRRPHTPFTSIRPMSSASLIAAKLKAMMQSTLAAWLLVLVAIPPALRLSGTWPLVAERARRLAEVMGTPRAAAIALLCIVALMASTWKQLVQSLYIGMSGREWLVKASVFVTLGVLSIALPVGHWILGSRRAAAVLWTTFPWIAAVLACVKIVVAAWIIVRMRDKRLMSDGALLSWMIGWDVVVFALYALLAWIMPALLVQRSLLALVAILAVPLARVSAAPLALAWNRHR
jgi:hypothetical protein